MAESLISRSSRWRQFVKENDETLYEHRKGNSAKLLLMKSLLSQSVPALVIASATDSEGLKRAEKKERKWDGQQKEMKGSDSPGKHDIIFLV